MDKNEFEHLMPKVDRELADRGIPVHLRQPYAHWRIAGPASIDLQAAYDESTPAYKGTNLFHKILEWYSAHYPKDAVCVPPFGRRPILVRGQPFVLRIPPIFNVNPSTKRATNYIEGISDSFLEILSPDEIQQVQEQFNDMAKQASRLTLLLVSLLREQPIPNWLLVKQLVMSGRADLNSATDAVVRLDAGSYPWCTQQAVEKHLKAYLSFVDPAVNASILKMRFGHNLPRLLDACSQHCASFEQVTPYIATVAVTPSQRYESPQLATREAVDRVNLAYAMCDLVAHIMLSSLKGKGAGN